MKHRLKIALLISAAALCTASAIGQTNAPAQLEAAPPTLEAQMAPAMSNAAPFTISDLYHSGGLKKIGQDLVSFIENTTNAGVVTVEAGALYGLQTHKVGGFLDAYFPIGGTNSVFGAGFGVAYLDHNFYDGTLNARIGDTFTVPFIHIPMYAYTEAGAGYNFAKNAIISQAFAGALFRIPITKSQTLTLGGAIGTISDQSGQIAALGGSYTFAW